MPELKEHLLQCFATVFPNLNQEEISSANMESTEDWDSVATVTLLAVIEEEIDVEFAPEDLVKLTSFELIFDVLRESFDPRTD